MNILIKILIWMIVLAFFHARQEIEIEGGRGGWARHLPTFRINIFLTKLLIGKELTGYHIYMMCMFLTIFHGIFLFLNWTWQVEALTIGLLSWYFIIEDFFWFLLNPHYGIKRFKEGQISWHKRWLWGLPTSYWWGILLGLLLIIYGMR